jgi:iron complex outermembrane receptor protein
MDMLDDIFALDLESLQNVKVSSVSKMDQSVKDVPANMLIVTKEQIDQRGYDALSDLLGDLPGVMIHNFSTSGCFNSVNIRGTTGAHYFKILLDGIEIDPTNGEMMSRAMNFPLNGIARVEVIYGPSSVVYGADAVSAVINMVSDNYSGGEFAYTTAKDNYHYANFRYAKQLGDYKLMIKGHMHRDQDYKLYEDYPQHFPDVSIIDSGSNVVEAAGSRDFDYQSSRTRSLNLALHNGAVELGINHNYTEDSTLLGQVDKKSYQNLFDDDSNIMVSFWGAYARYKTELYGMKSTTTFSFDTTSVEEGSYFINRNTDYKKAYKFSESKRYALEETLEKHYDAHHLIVGAVAEHYESMPMSFDLPTPYPSNSYTYPGSNIPINYFRKNWDNVAVYIQDYYTLDRHWKFSAAMRYDYNTIDNSIVTPRAALIYQPTDETTHKLIYSQAFLSPSMDQKYRHYGLEFELNDIVGDPNTYKVGYFRVPNEDLKPEKSRTLEYALFSKIKPKLYLQSAFYYTRVENLIGEREATNLSISDVTVLNATQIYNTGHAEFYGFELSLDGKTRYGKTDAHYWINYGYVDGHVKDLDGIEREAPFIVPHKVNAGITLSGQSWSVTPSIRWIDSINSGYFSGTNDDRESIKGYAVTNLFGRYYFTPKVVATLKAENLFDKRYYNARNGFSSTYITPQPGRMVYLGLKVNF